MNLERQMNKIERTMLLFKKDGSKSSQLQIIKHGNTQVGQMNLQLLLFWIVSSFFLLSYQSNNKYKSSFIQNSVYHCQ